MTAVERPRRRGYNRDMARRKNDNPWPGKLRKLREALGKREGKVRITQAEAAERLGVATATWIAWENSQRTPGRLTQRLLKATFPELG